MRTITVIGTGYVGLVTGACLAKMGHKVTCLDIDKNKINFLQQGYPPFYEPGLEEVVREGVKEGRLHFTTDYKEAILPSDLCFLALPTPSNEDGSCDLSYILQAALQLAEALIQRDRYLVIANKSTVPVGTADKVRQTIQQTLDSQGVQVPFDVISNPEFLREGTAVSDCMNPDRIILGVESTKAALLMQELYAPFPKERILIMDIASAELAKYACNAMLATRLSFMNHLAIFCEKIGADIKAITTAMGMDPRIGPSYLNPGIGFGGSCLPKDLQALRSIAKKHQHSTPLLDSVMEINQKQPELFFKKILHYFESLVGKTLAIWGLSFKPDTDDLREAPALFLIQKCLEHGALLRLYDPVSIPKAKVLLNQYKDLCFCSSPYHAAQGADAIILVTEWKEFKSVDFERIAATMETKVLFDGRNQYSENMMDKLGFEYYYIGSRNTRTPAYS